MELWLSHLFSTVDGEDDVVAVSSPYDHQASFQGAVYVFPSSDPSRLRRGPEWSREVVAALSVALVLEFRNRSGTSEDL
jgi:hypothetical protein